MHPALSRPVPVSPVGVGASAPDPTAGGGGSRGGSGVPGGLGESAAGEGGEGTERVLDALDARALRAVARADWRAQEGFAGWWTWRDGTAGKGQVQHHHVCRRMHHVMCLTVMSWC